MASFFSGLGGNVKKEIETTIHKHTLDDFTKGKEEEAKTPIETSSFMSKERQSQRRPKLTTKIKRKKCTTKKKRSQKRKKEKIREGSTISMRKKHHATLAHLVHDALVRLKCSPIYHCGYSKKAIGRNIERHYKLKLGEKFKLRLLMSLEKLVKKGNLIPHGKKRSGIKYKPRSTFLKDFSRLKVVNGGANHQFGGVICQHCKGVRSRSGTRGRSSSPSPSLSKSRSRSKRSSPCLKRRKVGRRKVGRRKVGRRKVRRRKVGRRIRWQDRSKGKRQKTHTKTTSQKQIQVKDSKYGGLASWFWSPKTEQIQHEDNISDTKPPVAALGREEKHTFLEGYSKKRKFEDKGESNKKSDFGSKTARKYRKFKRVQVRENASNSSSPKHYLSSKRSSEEKAEEDSNITRSELDSQSNQDSLDSMESCAQELENDSRENFYETSEASNNNEIEDIDEVDEDTMSESTTSRSNASFNTNQMRQMKEHDLLHAMQSTSKHTPLASHGSLLERIGAFCSGFGTQQTKSPTNQGGPSIASQNPSRTGSFCSGFGTQKTKSPTNQAGPSIASQKPSRIGSESSRSCIKDKRLIRKHDDNSITDASTPDGEQSPSPRESLSQLPLSPKLKRLLQG